VSCSPQLHAAHENLRAVRAHGGRFFTNAIDQDAGFDATAGYEHLEAPATSISATYNHTDNDISQSRPSPRGPSKTLFDRTESLRLTCGQPRDNLRLTGDFYEAAWWGVHHVTLVLLATSTVANDQTFEAAGHRPAALLHRDSGPSPLAPITSWTYS
jgi:hypothetical protein